MAAGKFHSEGRLGICEHLEHYVVPVPAAGAPTGAAAAAEGGGGGGGAPRVGIVTFLPSQRGVCMAPDALVGARLHTLGDWLVVTDGRLPRSFSSDHPV